MNRQFCTVDEFCAEECIEEDIEYNLQGYYLFQIP